MTSIVASAPMRKHADKNIAGFFERCSPKSFSTPCALRRMADGRSVTRVSSGRSPRRWAGGLRRCRKGDRGMRTLTVGNWICWGKCTCTLTPILWSSYHSHAHGALDSLINDHALYRHLGCDDNAREREYRALFRSALDD